MNELVNRLVTNDVPSYLIEQLTLRSCWGRCRGCRGFDRKCRWLWRNNGRSNRLR